MKKANQMIIVEMLIKRIAARRREKRKKDAWASFFKNGQW